LNEVAFKLLIYNLQYTLIKLNNQTTMPNILLIEDDKLIAEGIIFALKARGYSVNWCHMGLDALTYLKDEKVDLVLLDLGLPDIAGFDLLPQIRDISDIPVIIITAMSDDTDIVIGLEVYGADDYVTKPFNNRVLIARIKAQLKHTKSVEVSSNPVSIAPNQVFEINEALHQILLSKRVVNLTFAECRILMHLVKHPNRVHSKGILLDAMHDRPTGAGEDTIVTHIRNIRAALNKINPDIEYIKNHRKLGYSLRL
jgi:two-component system, OmpR family, catabolic regulation response regulator CreB